MKIKHLDKVSPQLPETLGQKTSALSTSMVLASDYVIPVTLTLDKDTGVVAANTLRVTVGTDDTVMTGIASTLISTDSFASSISTSSQSSLTELVTLNVTAGLSKDELVDQTVYLADIDGGTVQNGILLTSIESSSTASSATLSSIQTTAISIDGKTPGLGQAAKADSVPVTLASDQGNVGTTVSNLPTTVATAAGATTASTLRAVIATDQTAIPVSQSGTWAITGVSGTVSLPTGAATETTLSGMSAKLPATLGPKTGANSISVVFASDQASLQPTHAKVALLRNDHSSVAVSTSAYTQLTASTTAAIKRLHIFDSSGSALYLAVGAAASEVDYIFIPPGGIEWIEIDIPSASRLSIKAVDTATSSGQLLITALS